MKTALIGGLKFDSDRCILNAVKGGAYMTRESQKRATRKYDAKATVQVKMKLNKTTDADILQRLDDVPSKQGYIKSLIRADMKEDLK